MIAATRQAAGRTSEAFVPAARPIGRKKLRVLMTVDAVGGVWRYAVDLARALQPHGTQFLFAGFGPRPSATQMAEARRWCDVEWTGLELDWMAKRATDVATAPARIAAMAAAFGAGLVHANLPSQAAGLTGALPVVVVSHSCLPSWWRTMRGEPLPAEWRWHLEADRAGFDRADSVVAPSRAHADLIQQCHGPIERLAVVHNATSLAEDRSEKEPFVLATGRWWDEGKNGGVLDEAARSISWPVITAGATHGPGGQRIELRNVEAPGSLSHSEVRSMMRRAAIVVSPSRYEPFGLSALEGARSGAALVLSDIPTYRELWADAALFFEPDDPCALAAAVRRLIDDAGLRAAMGGRARARSRRFSPEAQALAMMEIYERSLARSGLPYMAQEA